MSSGIDDRPSLLNNQVTTNFVCSVRHYPHTISVNDHRDLMFKLHIRGLLFKFVDFLYSRSELFDRVIKVI